MKPEDYTEEILERKFAMVLCGNDGWSRSFYRSKDGAWGIPATFTLREARDGLPLPKSCNFWPKGLQLPVSKLEKLRRLKPGKKVQMTFGQHYHNNWWALRLDGESENNFEQEIQEKETKLQAVQAQIQKLAGKLLKEERKLQKELKDLRKKQTNS